MSSPSFSRRWRGLATAGATVAAVDRPDTATGGVRVLTLRGDLYVLPDEVLPLISANKVDKRLFDVTDLIEMGYDDAHASGVPLIATFSKARGSRQGHPGDPGGVLRRRPDLAEGQPRRERRIVGRFAEAAAQGRLRFRPGIGRHRCRIQHQAGGHPRVRRGSIECSGAGPAGPAPLSSQHHHRSLRGVPPCRSGFVSCGPC